MPTYPLRAIVEKKAMSVLSSVTKTAIQWPISWHRDNSVYNPHTGQGDLIDKTVAAFLQWEKDSRSFGELSSKLLNLMDPFHSSEKRCKSILKNRFWEDCKEMVEHSSTEPPFLYAETSQDSKITKKSLVIHSIRTEPFFFVIEKAYKFGNGFPVVRTKAADLYKQMISTLINIYIGSFQKEEPSHNGNS